MAEGSMSFHNINMGGNGVGVVDLVDETKTFAKFIVEPKLMVFESEQQGYPVFKNIEYIIVQHPGERDPIKKESSEFDRRRWPQAYARFKEGQKDIPEGTNLNVIFPANPSIAASFALLGIHTVEQLAETTDSGIGNIPFGFDARNRARKYVEQQNGAEGFNKLQAELANKDRELKSMQMQLTEMAETMAKFKADSEKPASAPTIDAAMIAQIAAAVAAANQASAPEKRGPGRPKTVQEA